MEQTWKNQRISMNERMKAAQFCTLDFPPLSIWLTPHLQAVPVAGFSSVDIYERLDFQPIR